MKKLFSLFLGLMLVFPLAFAEPGAGGKNCEPGTRLAEKLNLEESQVEPVKQIMQEQHEKRREMMKKNMAALHDETRERLTKVLTPEQLKKFDEMHAQKMEKMKERGEKWKKHYRESSDENSSKGSDS